MYLKLAYTTNNIVQCFLVKDKTIITVLNSVESKKMKAGEVKPQAILL